MKILLTGALAYDGLGSEPVRQDVLIDGERIVAVGQNLPKDGAKVWDVSGLSLSPGFIDAHSHNDWCAVSDDPIPGFEPFIQQGITSFVTGNRRARRRFEQPLPFRSGRRHLFPGRRLQALRQR